jgi:hypothetical protein
MSAEVASPLGCLLPTGAHCFQQLDGFPSAPSPGPLRGRVHPSLRCPRPQSTLLLVTRPTHVAEQPPLGSLFPFATQAYEVHSPPGFPHLTTIRPQCFAHSRRFPPSHTARACFIPLPRPGFTPQGISPPPSQLTSSVSCALLSFLGFSSRQVAPPVPDPPTSPSGPWSERRSVVTGRGVKPTYHSIPSRVFNSFGLFSERLGSALTLPPLMASRHRHSLYT